MFSENSNNTNTHTYPQNSTSQPHLDHLKDLFPDVADDIILDVLERAGNNTEKAVQKLLEDPPIALVSQFQQNLSNSLEVLSISRSDSLDFKLASLVEMFPQIEMLVILENLESNDGDLESTMNDLLNYETLKENNDEQVSLKDQQSITQVKKNPIDDLVSSTGIERADAKKYYTKNYWNFCKALVDIILNYRDDLEKLKKQSSPLRKVQVSDKQNIPTGGRVQSHYSVIPDDGRKVRSQNSKEIEEPPYHFNETNPEVVELAEFIFYNKALAEISWTFLEQAIIFFRGNTSRVVQVAIIILENGGAQETFTGTKTKEQELDFTKLFKDKPSPKSIDDGFVKISKLQTKKENTQAVNKTSHKNSGIKLEADLAKYQILLQRFQLSRSNEFSCLDLHHFHVTNAKITTERALKDWWQDELNAREYNGNTKAGTMVREITPLTIITGRGIHSDGGVSKVKMSIRALLKRSPYIFDEETSGFIVTGKKVL